MQIERMRKEYHQFLFMYLFIQAVLFIICFSIILSIDALTGYWPFAFLFGVIILFINIVFHSKREKDELYKETYRIRNFLYKIDLPESFVIHVRLVMPDGEKAYYANNQIIPAIFVEFVEGDRAFLAKQLTKQQGCENCKIIYIYKKKYALVEDKNRCRFIMHFDNLTVDYR